METLIGALGAGTVTAANGVFAAAAALMSPVVLSVVVTALAMWWLSNIELDELVRQGTKPETQIH